MALYESKKSEAIPAHLEPRIERWMRNHEGKTLKVLLLFLKHSPKVVVTAAYIAAQMRRDPDLRYVLLCDDNTYSHTLRHLINNEANVLVIHEDKLK